MSTALVIGASGAMGGAIASALTEAGHDVVGTSRRGGDGLFALDPLEQPGSTVALAARGPFHAVVWAQGVNVNDAADSVLADELRTTLDANVTFVAVSLAGLLDGGAIPDEARLVVLSSIWQEIARAGKFSYSISKAAIGGLVRAASADLASRGILINAILPSVTDTPMTRAMLSPEQVERVAGQTGFGRLTSLEDVAGLAAHLCSAANTGVTGQSIAVDLGFSHVRAL